MKKNYFLLTSRRFLPLFITQFLGAFNDNAFKNALLFWFTYDYAIKNDLDPSSMLSVAAIVFILPFFLFSATAGQLADRLEKSYLTRKIKFMEILIMSMAILGFLIEDITMLLTLLFLMGTQSTFFGPIKYALLPLHLEKSELLSGNGMIEGATFLAILLGTIFSGVLINKSNGLSLITVILLGIAVIGYIYSLLNTKNNVSDANIKLSFNIAKSTWSILQHSIQNKITKNAILANSWFWLVGVTFLTQFPVYTKDFIHGNNYIVTLFLTIFSIGIGIGSILCSFISKGKISLKLTCIGTIGMSLSIFLFYISSFYFSMHIDRAQNLLGIMTFLQNGLSAWLICFSLCTLAISSGLYIVPLYALIQKSAKPLFISRTIAATNIINALGMVASGLISILLFKMGLNCLQLFLFIAVLNSLLIFWLINFSKTLDQSR